MITLTRTGTAVAAVAAIAVVAGALVGGAAYTSSEARADAQHTVDARASELTATIDATERALAAERDRVDEVRARLTAATAIAEGWKSELGLSADAALTTLESTAAAALAEPASSRGTIVEVALSRTIAVADPNERPPASEAPVLVELGERLSSLETELAQRTGEADALTDALSTLGSAWRDRIAAWAAATADAAAAANPHAATALPAVTAARDGVTAVTDVFGANAPTAITALRDAVAAAQAEEAAWQAAEAERLAAEASRTTTRQSGGAGGGGSGGGSSGGSGGGESSGGGGSAVSGTDRTSELLSLVNQARAEAGLGALSSSSSLTGTSCAQSQWMNDTGTFAHGATSGWSGENIAYGYASSQAVFTAWMNSSGHRANILGTGFTRMGACQVGTYWTQQFG